MIELTEYKARTWLLQSFRYCLGRATYVTGECVEDLTEHWDLMAQFHKQIHRDIQTAIKMDRAGYNMDIVEWEKILKLKVKDDR